MMDDLAATAARDRVLGSLDRLDASRRRAEHTSIGASGKRTSVTEALLARLSASARATPELRAFASQVAVGNTTWDRIEVDADPVPPEVSELRSDPHVDWPTNWPLHADEEPYRIPWQ